MEEDRGSVEVSNSEPEATMILTPPSAPQQDAVLSLRVGDEVVIRRSSGAEQVAVVHELRSDREYIAPEVINFCVTFWEDGKKKGRWCSANDLIRS